MHKYTSQTIVENYLALLFSATLGPDKVQYVSSYLWCERLVKIIRCGKVTKQMLSSLAVWIKALGDVKGGGDGILFVFQTQSLQGSQDIFG